MKKTPSIAVVGQSMAGKSTFISSMYSEEVIVDLYSFTKQNNEGQTKVSANYEILAEEGIPFTCQGIEWNKEKIEEVKEKMAQSDSSVNSAVEIFSETFPISVDLDIFDYILNGGFDSSHCVEKVKWKTIFEKIINSREIRDLEIIRRVNFSGSANRDVSNALKEIGIQSIKLLDTCGLLDEPLEKMHERQNKNNAAREKNMDDQYKNPKYEENIELSELSQQALDERGIHGIDACIFMYNGGGSTLMIKDIKETYSALLEVLLSKYPTFLVGRSGELTKKMIKNSEEDLYSKCNKDVLEDDFFDGFDDIRNLLKEFRSESDDFFVELLNAHYDELLLANISKKNRGNEEAEKCYMKSVVGVLKKVLINIQEYDKELEAAEKFQKEFEEFLSEDKTNEFKKIYDQYFDKELGYFFQEFSESSSIYPKCEYCISGFYYRPSHMVKEISSDYYGGLVGPRGGLTPKSDRRAAYDILSWAYYCLRLIGRNYFECGNAFQTICNCMRRNFPDLSENDISTKAKKMCVKLHTLFARRLDELYDVDVECTLGRIMNRRFLYDAREKTCDELGVVYPNKVGKFLPELEKMHLDRYWEDDRHRISVVKRIVWNVICLAMEEK